MADEEHGGAGKAGGGAPKQKMTVRWGKVVFEDVEAGDAADATPAPTTAESPARVRDTPRSPTPGPRSRPPSKKVAHERREGVSRTDRRLRIALGVSIAAIIVLLMRNPSGGSDALVIETPPPTIVGTWVTEHPRYAGRSFVISEQLFELHLAEDGVQQFDIRETREIETEDSWRYEIAYRSSEGDIEHVFFLYPDGTVRVRNEPQVVWIRAPAG